MASVDALNCEHTTSWQRDVEDQHEVLARCGQNITACITTYLDGSELFRYAQTAPLPRVAPRHASLVIVVPSIAVAVVVASFCEMRIGIGSLHGLAKPVRVTGTGHAGTGQGSDFPTRAKPVPVGTPTFYHHDH
ncbi:hypothetical protein EDB85DRAFT_1890138 [Lactarius pseudohatsudake]|nr:hypothetical protein EDB85DRAFT_1890138 [Lactarius pseudohatsudake]